MIVYEYRDMPDGEVDLPALSHHLLPLHLKPKAEFSLETGGKGHRWSPDPGSITVIPAGSATRWSWRGRPDTLLVLLNAQAVSSIALTEPGVDPTHLLLDPVIAFQDAQILSVLSAIRSELHSGGFGGPLCVESLRNLLAIHLLRRFAEGGVRRPPGGRLSPGQLRRVLDYIEDNLGEALGLGDLAASVGLSVYHFARLFKASTGRTPHGHVIVRRIERAKLLLGRAETVAEVAAEVGFSDQSHFTRHFKRLVGVTPTRFR